MSFVVPTPIPFDAEYTRDLGYGAACHVLDGGSDAMITRQKGGILPIPFDEIIDPSTGRTRIRTVNIKSMPYEVARKYMIRLTPDELADDGRAQQLARAGNTTVEDLRRRFG